MGVGLEARLRLPSGGTTKTGAKWWPRKMLRTHGYVPYEIYPGTSGNANPPDYIGYLWINAATLVGAGGTAVTITSESSMFRLFP